jgi:hypothetical protein
LVGDGRVMFDAYVIEVHDEAAGIVARNGKNFVFYASSHKFNALEGRRFKRVADAQRAATEVHRRKESHHSMSRPTPFEAA